MRHHWQHPAFTKIHTPNSEHENWIRNFANEWNFDYDELIAAATGKTDWRHVKAYGRDLHGASDLGEDHELFWEHLEGLTGERYSQDHREGMGWSCSC
ncbi:MAG TPA: hypothetical protein PLP33_14520 [Leptospiraceae bacterium]|nr:hypothetical protein [Leptospiraceae bacterium]